MAPINYAQSPRTELSVAKTKANQITIETQHYASKRVCRHAIGKSVCTKTLKCIFEMSKSVLGAMKGKTNIRIALLCSVMKYQLDAI